MENDRTTIFDRAEPEANQTNIKGQMVLGLPAQYAEIARFKHLTEVALPTRAREQRWPIRLDHCFKRICLDAAFGDVWYNHLPRPAERNLSGEPLTRAIACAEAILAGGLPVLTLRNAESLRYRGKHGPRSACS